MQGAEGGRHEPNPLARFPPPLQVYRKIQEGADVNFVFGRAYSSLEGYTPLMAAAHRGHLESARALLRAGADPNYINGWAPLLSSPPTANGGHSLLRHMHEVCRAQGAYALAGESGCMMRMHSQGKAVA